MFIYGTWLTLLLYLLLVGKKGVLLATTKDRIKTITLCLLQDKICWPLGTYTIEADLTLSLLYVSKTLFYLVPV